MLSLECTKSSIIYFRDYGTLSLDNSEIYRSLSARIRNVFFVLYISRLRKFSIQI